MSDDKSKTRPQDSTRVNVHEAYELQYWTKKWGITAEELKAAVAKVGPTVKALEAELQRA